MIDLFNKETNAYLGEISEEELSFLMENLEEESLTDNDYYIDRDTLEVLKENGMSAPLAKMIGDAMADREEIEIIYKRK